MQYQSLLVITTRWVQNSLCQHNNNIKLNSLLILWLLFSISDILECLDALLMAPLPVQTYSWQGSPHNQLVRLGMVLATVCYIYVCEAQQDLITTIWSFSILYKKILVTLWPPTHPPPHKSTCGTDQPVKQVNSLLFKSRQLRI